MKPNVVKHRRTSRWSVNTNKNFRPFKRTKSEPSIRVEIQLPEKKRRNNEYGDENTVSDEVTT